GGDGAGKVDIGPEIAAVIDASERPLEVVGEMRVPETDAVGGGSSDGPAALADLPGDERLLRRDAMPADRPVAGRRDQRPLTELGRGLFENRKPRRVDAVVVRDQKSHDEYCKTKDEG